VNKEIFLKELKQKLTALSVEEREAAITYYEEYFNDAGIENEQSVINELGSVEKVANGILKENNYPVIDSGIKESEDNKYNKEEHSNNKINYVGIILLVIIFSILFPVIVPIFFAILGVIIGFIFAGVGIVIAGIAVSVMGLVTLFLTPMSGLLILGLGLILFSFGIIITTFMVNICVVVIPSLIRSIVKLFRFTFQKGGINI
jgi:uncharacterized membrane protein